MAHTSLPLQHEVAETLLNRVTLLEGPSTVFGWGLDGCSPTGTCACSCTGSKSELLLLPLWMPSLQARCNMPLQPPSPFSDACRRPPLRIMDKRDGV